MSQGAGSYREASLYRSNSADSITAAASQMQLQQGDSPAHVTNPPAASHAFMPYQANQHSVYSGHNKENKKPSPECEYSSIGSPVEVTTGAMVIK